MANVHRRLKDFSEITQILEKGTKTMLIRLALGKGPRKVRLLTSVVKSLTAL